MTYQIVALSLSCALMAISQILLSLRIRKLERCLRRLQRR